MYLANTYCWMPTSCAVVPSPFHGVLAVVQVTGHGMEKWVAVTVRLSQCFSFPAKPDVFHNRLQWKWVQGLRSPFWVVTSVVGLALIEKAKLLSKERKNSRV